MINFSAAIPACDTGDQWQHVTPEPMGCSGSSTLNMFSFRAAISACEKGGKWKRLMHDRGPGAGYTVENLCKSGNPCESMKISENQDI
eukprot:8515704-Karenia_brevis.AAC.1